MAVENGRLKIFAPSQEFVDKVKASATSVGDSFFLSEADKQVLALALEIKARGDNPQIVTDDYSIQNVAKSTGAGVCFAGDLRHQTAANLDKVLPSLPPNVPSKLQGIGMHHMWNSPQAQTSKSRENRKREKE